jgi:hypothetical protein
MTWPVPLTDPGWLGAFALLFVGALMVNNVITGWWSLVREFRAWESTEGQRIHFVSGRMGRNRFLSIDFRASLILTLTPRGFRLAVLFPFGVLSPPLFIPWTAVESLEWHSGGFTGAQARLRLRGHWPQIAIQGRAGERLRDQHAAWQAAGSGASGGRTAPSWPYA